MGKLTLRLPGLQIDTCSGLTPRFDRLSTMSLPKEEALPDLDFNDRGWRRRMGQGVDFFGKTA